MIIGSINDGIVIDHIPAGKGMELYQYLNLAELECEVAVIKNAPSEKLGRKDIIKVAEPIEINLDILGFFSSAITVNYIKDGKKVGKKHPVIPEQIVDMIRCKNPRCITSIEQELPQIFVLTDRDKGIYRCRYCDTKAK
ncbi:MAG: aspartate carbamoyltransferase regulatory subunit [Oscillospiraceae bacterium]|nr:aspartate carbamoyltransferase regulatory subunit [Oscillospiraceae bacterium]